MFLVLYILPVCLTFVSAENCPVCVAPNEVPLSIIKPHQAEWKIEGELDEALANVVGTKYNKDSDSCDRKFTCEAKEDEIIDKLRRAYIFAKFVPAPWALKEKNSTDAALLVPFANACGSTSLDFRCYANGTNIVLNKPELRAYYLAGIECVSVPDALNCGK